MRNTVSSMALAGTEDRSRARRRTIAIELVLGSALLVLFSVLASRLEVLETVFWALSTFGITALHEAIFLSPAFAAFLIYRRSREYRAERTRALAAERAALAGEQRFQDLVEVSGDWIWETDSEYRFTYMSPRHDDARLQPTERLIGRTRWDFIGDYNRRQLEALRADMEARRTVRNFVYPIKDPAGRLRHIRINGKPFCGLDGAFLGYRGVATDVTAEVETQKEIAVAHRRLVDAIESLPAAIMLFDAEERLVLWNSRVGRLYAPLRDLFVVGTSYAELLAGMVRVGVVADPNPEKETWMRRRLEAFRGGQDLEDVPLTDGRWLRALNHKTMDGGTICVRIDVTELKQREAELERQRALLQATLDNIEQGLCAYDAEGRLVAWNERLIDLLELPRELVRAGTRIEDLARVCAERGDYGPGDTESLLRRHLGDIAGSMRPLDLLRTTPKGRVLQSTHTRTADGGIVTTYSDVTEVKRQQAELARQQSLLETTLASMSQGLAVYDQDLRLVLWNGAYVKLLGYASSAVTPGATFADLIRDQAMRGDFGVVDVEATVEEHSRRMKAVKGLSVYVRERPDGSFVEVRRARMPDGHIVNTFTDITELKRHEAELERQSALLQATIDNLSQGVAVYDGDHRLVLSNNRYAEMFGVPADWVAPGIGFEELTRKLAARGEFGPGDPETVTAEIMRQFRAAPLPSTLTRTRPDGEVIDIRRGPMPDGGFVSTFTDVTAFKRQQDEIERQSGLLQATLESMGQGLSVYDEGLRLIAWNRRYFELFDLPSGFARVGTPFADIVRYLAIQGEYGPGDPEEIAVERIGRIADRSDLWSFQRTRPNGITLELRRYAMPQGGFVTVYTDITERVQAERILQESEARAAAARRQLGDAIESMSEGFALFDPDRRLVAWNRKLINIHPAIADLVTGGPSFEDLTRALVERGQIVSPFQSADQYLAHSLSMTAGERKAVDCQLREGGWVRTTARRTSDGGIVTIHSDVTETKRREVELMTLSERLRTRSLQFNVALDNMVQGLCMFDAEQRLIVCNRRYLEIFDLTSEIAKPGVTLRQLLEHSIAAGVYATEDAERIIVRRLAATEASQRTQVEAQLSNGRVIEVISQPMADGGTLATYEDITARRQVERQLRHAQKMDAVGRMTGGVAHEFNNLLTAMGGFTRMALRRVEDPEHVSDCLGEVIVAADRAATLTRQMLAFSRNQILEPRIVSVGEIVTRHLKMLTSLIGEQIRLTTTVEDEAATVLADPDQLAQVVMNLAINARDAMPEGGDLEIGTRMVDRPPESAIGEGEAKPGRHVAIFVRDSGCGMDDETRKKIFEPFFTTKDPGHGTGLGLSVVHGIVEQSGGRIDVETALGRGTTFTVYLPVATTESPAPATGADEDLPAPAAAGATVLLVEDEDAVRRLAKAELEMLGFRVLTAANGKEALAVHASHAGRIDLLLTDVVMPEMGGPETARALTAARPELKVVFMTGYPSRGHFRRSDLGDDAVVLDKPFTDKRLAETIRGVLGDVGLDDGPGDGARRAA